MSDFWDELLSLSGTKLQFTTAYHPQTDGQSEVTNRALEQYLRSFTCDRPNRWSQLLPWAELALNCSLNTSIGMSPFQALYGREPPNLFSTYPRPSHNMAVRDILEEREETLHALKERIARSQRQMAEYANRRRKDVAFNVGDKVLLRLQPYRQHSVGKPLSAKLGRRFYGPFVITEKIGAVAYRLQLPADSKIHNVFHVSLLKPFVPPISDIALPEFPGTFQRGQPIDTPIKATASRIVLVDRVPQEQWLVQWSSAKDDPSSWEPVELLRSYFPHLRLEDKAVVMGEGVDRDSTTQPLQSTNKTSMQVDEQLMQPEMLPKTTSVQTKETEGEKRGERPKRKKSKPARYQDCFP